MLKNCCGGFSESISERLNRYLSEYKNTGEASYFYSISGVGIIQIVRAESFKIIFERHIEPNLDKGALCFHISHFNGSTDITDYAIIPTTQRVKSAFVLGDNRDSK